MWSNAAATSVPSKVEAAENPRSLLTQRISNQTVSVFVSQSLDPQHRPLPECSSWWCCPLSLAVAAAKPSGIGAVAYSSVLSTPIVHKTIVAPAPVAVPAAVSSSFRTDVISKPVVAAYAAPAVVAAPVVQKTVVAAAPVVAPAPVAIPAAVSSSYRTDVINSRPVVAAYAAPVFQKTVVAPVVQKTVVAAAPVAVPAAVSSSYRSDVINSHSLAVAPVVSYAAAVPAVQAW
ncbi:hypothetical protein NQ318_006106 [Aromia moschata]|uniref:Uncharacterized protein n=1 Tax=Aromia moschata TaxID=1265417 RepID=A0AAV8Z206_9CUCU|nr:hypothetical protein NQ318_006106 [Aromia moschata]